MTLAEMQTSTKALLTCLDASEVLQVNAYNLHLALDANPNMFGFPVMVIGRQVRIPRVSLLKFLGAA